jgi:hypothetical protein
MKSDCWFSKIVSEGLSWPFDPKGKVFLARRKKKVGPPQG